MQVVINTLAKAVLPPWPRSPPSTGRSPREPATSWPYFDGPGTLNGPTEAINGRLEELRGTALGFRNLTSYIARHYSRAAATDPGYTVLCEEP